MGEPNPDLVALVERAIALAEQTASTQEAIVSTQTKLSAQQRRLRIFARWLGGSLAADIALSTTLIFLVSHQATLTNSIHDSQVAACAIGNQSRAAQVEVLDHLISGSKGPPGETPVQRDARLRAIAAARSYVDSHFKPVDCTALYSGQ